MGTSILRSSWTFGALALVLVTAGCNRSRKCYEDNNSYGYGGGGYYYDSGVYYWDSGYYEEYSYTYAEIGIGTNTFIEVPPGQQVSPEQDPAGRYFNVAIRGYGFERGPVRVDLVGWVGDERYAQNSYDNVQLTCRPRLRSLEAGSMRLELDPSILPPQTPPPAPVPRVDTGFREGPVWRESGDTGFYVEPIPRGDFRVTATITEPRSQRVTQAETTWFVYR